MTVPFRGKTSFVLGEKLCGIRVLLSKRVDVGLRHANQIDTVLAASLGLAACTGAADDATADAVESMEEVAAEVTAAADEAAADTEAAADDAMAEMDEMAGEVEATVDDAMGEEAPAE